LHVDRRPGALVDDDALHRRARIEGVFDSGEKLHFGAAAITSILRDDGIGLAIVNAVDEGVGGKSPEDYGVRRADAGAGEHGNGQFGRHAHVDGDAVVLLHPKGL